MCTVDIKIRFDKIFILDIECRERIIYFDSVTLITSCACQGNDRTHSVSEYLHIYVSTCLDIYTIRREQERLTYWRPASAVSLPGSVWGHKSSCALHDLANIYVSTYQHTYLTIYKSTSAGSFSFNSQILKPHSSQQMINFRYLLFYWVAKSCWLLHPCPRESRSVKIFAYKCDLVSQHFNECQ